MLHFIGNMCDILVTLKPLYTSRYLWNKSDILKNYLYTVYIYIYIIIIYIIIIYYYYILYNIIMQCIILYYYTVLIIYNIIYPKKCLFSDIFRFSRFHAIKIICSLSCAEYVVFYYVLVSRLY